MADLRVRTTIKNLIGHDRGNVAMLFGLILLPMIGAMGLAIDFGMILTARTKAQVAADAAALQASGVARDLIKSGDGSEASTAAAVADAKRRAELLFKAHAEQSGLNDYTPTVSVVRTGQSIVTTVGFSVRTSTYLARIFGNEEYSSTGSAVSSSSLPRYSDVYLALDISGSMGIAATQAEMVKLFNAQGEASNGSFKQTSCVFGCHTIENGWKESFSAVAYRNGVRLRIDVLRDAVKKMIQTAETDADAAPIYRMAIYTLGGTADASTWSLNSLKALTDDFAALRTAANTIDIPVPPKSAPQKQTTYINEQLSAVAPYLPTSYDGSSQANSKKYVFLITDGARDVPPSFGSCTHVNSRCVNGINADYCKTIKDKGITMGVLYTTYVPVAENPSNPEGKLERYFKQELVDTGAYAKIKPALQQCATPGWFFEASEASAIDAAMQAMFAQTTHAPSLTN